MSLRLATWNVNGLRAVLRNSFDPFLQAVRPDIVCLQETKLTPDQAPDLALPFRYRYWHGATVKAGYSGVAILSNVEPLNVTTDLPGATFEHPGEGRVLNAEFPDFYLVSAYVPNSKRGLIRLDYRKNHWDPDFREHLATLARQKPVIVCGDLNCAHEPLDLANPQSNRKNAGFTDEERQGFTRLLDAGFVDVFRQRHPDEKGHYTWWSYRPGVRERNIGWRIDYFLVSTPLVPRVRDVTLHPNVLGSDHCPVSLDLD